jgi:hypothetical protein
VRAPDIQGQPRRFRRAKRILDVRIKAHRAAELTEQGLLRVGDVTRQRAQCTLCLPYLLGVDDQARLLDRLQREVQSPHQVRHHLANGCLSR